MKKTKIVIPALGLLLLSTAASVTGTVAWFSANTSVKISGMAVTTKVSGNLLIASSNSSDDNYTAADLVQPVSGVLEPISTIDAVDFYYTKDKVTGTGSATTTGETQSVFAQYTDAASFASYYEVTGAIGYADYVFYLKATSSSDGQKVVLSKANLLYNNAAITSSEKAWRVGVFAEPVAKEAAGSAVSTTLNKSILSMAGAVNFTSGKAVDSIDGDGKATLGDVANPNSACTLGTISTAGLTQRYKVTVRMWLEGEDKTCNNETFATLVEAYSLDLQVKLVDSTDSTSAATAITSAVA